MAITVNYAPAASTLGQAGFMAGRGNYATDERRYRDKMQLATEELLQNERMQQRQIQATARNNLINQTAAAQRQMLGLRADLVSQARQQEAREKMAVFDQYAGMRNRYQQAQLQSALGTQEAYQQNWLSAQDDMRRQMMLQNQMEMQQNIAEQEQQEKIQFAQQQAAQKRQAILDAGRQRIEAVQMGIDSGRIPRESGLTAMARMRDEAAAQAVGIEWETEIPEGLTPKESLKQEFDQSHVMFEGQPFVKDDDGNWMVPRGYSMPEQEQGPSPYEQSVMEQSKVQQDLFNKNLESFNKEVSARQEEIRKEVAQRIDELRTMNVNAETGVAKPISAQESARIRQQVEAEVGGYWPVPTRPQAPPAMPANPLMYPTPGPIATPPGQGQFSVPSAAPPQATAAPQRPPNNAPQNVFDGPTLQDGRPKIDSLYDLTRIEGTPPDLQRDELLAIGSSLVPNTEAGEQALAALNPQQRAVIDRYNSYAGIAASGSDGLNDPKFYESDKERYMAANIVSGAVAMYGTNTDAWPPQVQAELVVPMKVLNETEELLSSGSE